jgi:hypothetical protein
VFVGTIGWGVVMMGDGVVDVVISVLVVIVGWAVAAGIGAMVGAGVMILIQSSTLVQCASILPHPYVQYPSCSSIFSRGCEVILVQFSTVSIFGRVFFVKTRGKNHTNKVTVTQQISGAVTPTNLSTHQTRHDVINSTLKGSVILSRFWAGWFALQVVVSHTFSASDLSQRS